MIANELLALADNPLLDKQRIPNLRLQLRALADRVADVERLKYPKQPPGQEWPAKLRLTELLREAANALEACHAANEDLLSKRATSAPLQDEARELLEELSRRTAMMFTGPDCALHERIRIYLEKHK